MMLGSLLLMPVYLMMAYSAISLYVPVTLMGIAFSLIPAVMWPAVAYVVEQSRLGTAYALMTLIQQIGFFLLNLLIGKANDYAQAGPGNPAGYALGMWIFSVLGFIGMALSIALRVRETGPHRHGLETITTASGAGE
jgi:MFS family permease